MTHRILALSLTSVVACADVAPVSSSRERAVGSFVFHVDPAAGTVEVSAVGSSARGVHVEAPLLQNGSPGTPAGTLELITTNARLGPGGAPACPAGENCFTVELVSNAGRDVVAPVLRIDAITPPTGRAQTNGLAMPPMGSGLTAGFGLTSFGAVLSQGASNTQEINLSIPDASPFDVFGTLYEEEPVTGPAVVNGDFETGDQTGWTLTFTPEGVTNSNITTSFDIDGPGPLGTTFVPRFEVGHVNSSGIEAGIELTQPLALTTGVAYTFDFDWAAYRFTGSGNSEGGVFSLIVDGVIIAQQSAGPTSPTLHRFGHVSGVFVAAETRDHTVGVRITRPFTVPGTPLHQSFDNFTVTF